jgi:predicted P-loop ATPase
MSKPNIRESASTNKSQLNSKSNSTTNASPKRYGKVIQLPRTYAFALWQNKFAKEPLTTDRMTWAEFVHDFQACPRAASKHEQVGWTPFKLERVELTDDERTQLKRRPKSVKGLRRMANVRYVTMAVADLDRCTQQGLDNLIDELRDKQVLFLMHSTASHQPEAPKVRLILPLAKPIAAELWKGAWLDLAQQLNSIEGVQVDGQCKDSSRLYFIPSKVRGCPDPIFEFNLEGECIKLDTSAKPSAQLDTMTSDFEFDRTAARSLQKKLERRTSQDDLANAATLKKILAGASFASKGNRDTTMFKLATAIVRVYPGVNPKSVAQLMRASLAKDTDLHKGDPFTAEVVIDKIERAKLNLQEQAASSPGAELDLKRNLETGRVLPTLGNVETILAKHPDWQGVLGYDQLGRTAYAKKPLPLNRERRGKRMMRSGPFTDVLQTYVQLWLSDTFEIEANDTVASAAIRAAAHREEFHPVKDYLQGLEWDGVNRLNTVLFDYFGAEDTPWTRLIGSKVFISMVARAFDPGCQVDTMLVLEGPQGYGKSSAIRALMPDPAWYSSTKLDFKSKDGLQCLQGKWCHEVAELSSFKGAQIEVIKNVITDRNDHYRGSYDRYAADHPRTCVFFGTTNETQYLNDPTGARRFLPVRLVRKADVEAIERDRDQLWAEAVHRYLEDERWHLTDEEERLARREQAQRNEDDVLEEPLDAFIADCEQVAKNENKICQFTLIEVVEGVKDKDKTGAAFGIENPAGTRRLAGLLRKLGWVRETVWEKRDGKRVSTKVYRHSAALERSNTRMSARSAA